MDKNTYNPWLGLVPYSEDTDLSINPFKGREQQTKELYRMVSGNVITTLYGKSGVGKSSLLAAGLFPMLKSQHCIPFKIRLYTECQAGKSFAQHITDVLSPFATPLKGLKYKPLPSHSVDYLWRYMAFHSFQDKGKDVTPILVLDQFEELLRNRNSDALLLIKQIRKLLDDGLLPNGDAYKIRFRIVLSLREDDLYLLEDLLDSNSIDRMKLNRYRLVSVDKKSAREIIEMPDAEFTDKEVCIERAIHYADPHNEGQISTLLLSLICFRAWNKANGHPLTPDDFGPNPEKNDNRPSFNSPIEEFYNEATRKLDNNEQKYLLDHSITDDGRRQSIKASELKGRLSPEAFGALTSESSQYRIFTLSSGKNEREVYYELLHDQIAEAVVSKRQKWQMQRRMRRIRNGLTAAAAIITAIILANIFVPMRMRATTPLKQSHFKVGDTLPVPSKPYNVKSGRLIIDDLSSLQRPNQDYESGTSLLNIKNAKYLELPAGILHQDYSYLRFPETDTLVLNSNSVFDDQCSLTNLKSLFPNIKQLTINNYKFGNSDTICICIPTLKSIKLSGNDNNIVRLYRGTVYHLVHDGSKPLGLGWYPLITGMDSKDSIFYNPTDFGWGPVHNAIGIREYDVSQPIINISPDFKVQIVNTNKRKKILTKEDISYISKSQIISIDLPYIEDITNCRFDSCYDLKSVNMPDLKTIPADAFSFNDNLRTIVFSAAKEVGSYAFNNCLHLDSIHLPQATDIGSYSFFNCKSISEIEMPLAKEIRERAFAYCISLLNINIPNAEAIGDWAFENCSSLQSIILPKVKSFNANSLKNTACTEVVLPNLITIIGAKELTNDERKEITIHTPLFNLSKDDTTSLPANVIQHEDNELETIAKELDIKLETKYKKGYNIRGKVLTITDSIVPYLHVPRYVNNIIIKYSNISIHRFTASPLNKRIRWGYKRLILYKSSSLIKRTIYKNAKTLPFVSADILENAPSKCERIRISENNSKYLANILFICNNYKGSRQYELLVPYGTGQLFEGLKDKNQFKKIREMGWGETVVYYIIELTDFRGLPTLIFAILLTALLLISSLHFWKKRKWISALWPNITINILVGFILFIVINVSLLRQTTLFCNVIVVIAFIVWLMVYSLILNRKYTNNENNI